MSADRNRGAVSVSLLREGWSGDRGLGWFGTGPAPVDGRAALSLCCASQAQARSGVEMDAARGSGKPGVLCAGSRGTGR